MYNIIVINNRILKVYLDTSVLSHLWQIDAPEKMQETLALWEELKKNRFNRGIAQKVYKSIELVSPTYFLEEE